MGMDPVTVGLILKGVIATGAVVGAGATVKSGIDQKHAEKRRRKDQAALVREQELAQGQALLSEQNANVNTASTNIDMANRLTATQSGATGGGSGSGGKLGGKINLTGN